MTDPLTQPIEDLHDRLKEQKTDPVEELSSAFRFWLASLIELIEPYDASAILASAYLETIDISQEMDQFIDTSYPYWKKIKLRDSDALVECIQKSHNAINMYWKTFQNLPPDAKVKVFDIIDQLVMTSLRTIYCKRKSGPCHPNVDIHLNLKLFK